MIQVPEQQVIVLNCRIQFYEHLCEDPIFNKNPSRGDCPIYTHNHFLYSIHYDLTENHMKLEVIESYMRRQINYFKPMEVLNETVIEFMSRERLFYHKNQIYTYYERDNKFEVYEILGSRLSKVNKVDSSGIV